MAEYTLQHTAVEVDNAVGKALSIEANPTMAGTEAALNGLQIGDTKYKVEAGSEIHTYTANKTYTSADADYEQLRDDITNIRDIKIGTYYYTCTQFNNNNNTYFYNCVYETSSNAVATMLIMIQLNSNNVVVSSPTNGTYRKVEANEALAGTESNLTELTVQNTKYKLGYLPLTGGTMTGSITGTNGDIITDSQNRAILTKYNFENTTIVNYGNSGSVKLHTGNVGDSSKVYHSMGNEDVEMLDAFNTSANPGNTTASLTSLKLNGTNYAIAGGTQVTFVDWS